jgi:hypothetical protein
MHEGVNSRPQLVEAWNSLQASFVISFPGPCIRDHFAQKLTELAHVN